MIDGFDEACDLVLTFEGGYSNDPRDPGGETKFGISKRAYPNVDIASLTVADAREIYRRDYWLPVIAETQDSVLRLLAFDAAVNHGVARAVSWLRMYRTPMEFMAYRLMFYSDLETWPTFGRGWTRRAAHLMRAVSTRG